VVKPTFKDGDHKNVKNFMPISLLSNFEKIFEKIIKQRLMAFLEEYKFLSKNQVRFRPGLGAENALFNTTQFIYNELDDSSKVLAVFLDLAKVFDSVNHAILFQILLTFGINNVSLSWFRSYLFNRKQMVRIANVIG